MDGLERHWSRGQALCQGLERFQHVRAPVSSCVMDSGRRHKTGQRPLLTAQRAVPLGEGDTGGMDAPAGLLWCRNTGSAFSAGSELLCPQASLLQTQPWKGLAKSSQDSGPRWRRTLQMCRSPQDPRTAPQHRLRPAGKTDRCTGRDLNRARECPLR